ncbi:MAG: hypothetical protein IBJ18_00685 [Phycisphaerales bacterium]|nr:hypothetical protein [Phycisphaerales bacterium]
MYTNHTNNTTPTPNTPATSPASPTRAPRQKRKLLWGFIPAAGVLAVLASCAEVATPFRGPGYDASSRTLLPIESVEANGQPTYILALTNATLDRSRRGIFDAYTRKLEKALPDTPGLVGFSIRARLLGSEVWTMTLWTSDEAADDFVGSPLHRKAIKEAMPAVLTSRFYRGPWTSTKPPTWAEAKALLESAPVNNYRSDSPASESPTTPTEAHR